MNRQDKRFIFITSVTVDFVPNIYVNTLTFDFSNEVYNFNDTAFSVQNFLTFIEDFFSSGYTFT